MNTIDIFIYKLLDQIPYIILTIFNLIVIPLIILITTKINKNKFNENLESLLSEKEKKIIADLRRDNKYLLNRLEYHVNAMAQRYEGDVEVQHIDFTNPLLRK